MHACMLQSLLFPQGVTALMDEASANSSRVGSQALLPVLPEHGPMRTS